MGLHHLTEIHGHAILPVFKIKAFNATIKEEAWLLPGWALCVGRPLRSSFCREYKKDWKDKDGLTFVTGVTYSDYDWMQW